MLVRDVNPNLFGVQQKFVVLLCSVILDIFSLTPQGTRLTQSFCKSFCVSLAFHFNKSWKFCLISNRLEGQLRSQQQFVYLKVGIFFWKWATRWRCFVTAPRGGWGCSEYLECGKDLVTSRKSSQEKQTERKTGSCNGLKISAGPVLQQLN